MRARIRDQALEVGRGWSGPEAPSSWALTAALFGGLAADDDLLAVAGDIPLEKLPALLFVASVQYLAGRHLDDPFAAYFPSADAGTQPQLDDSFARRYRRFCLEHREELAAVWDGRVYQMNEVARSAQVAMGLGVVHGLAPDRAVALVDVGTGAGLGLFPDRYRYHFSDGSRLGDSTSPVQIPCVLQGSVSPRSRQLPVVGSRVGIDIDPIDLDDERACAWLTACLPPEVGALGRAKNAISVVRGAGVDIVRGAANDVLPGVLASRAGAEMICVIDTYCAVFFDAAERQQFQTVIASYGEERDIVWISLDPLVPLGTDAQHTAQGAVAPRRLVDSNRAGGVFGVLSLSAHIGGTSTSTILAIAHPSGTRMEWLDLDTALS